MLNTKDRVRHSRGGVSVLKSIQVRTWTLFAAFTLGLIGFGYWQYTSLEQATERSGIDRAHQLAEIHAARVSEGYKDLRRVLRNLSRNEAIRSLTADQCELVSLDLGAAVVHIVNRDGEIVCTSRSRRSKEADPDPDREDQGPRFADAKWLNITGEKVQTHFVERSPTTHRAAVQLVVPAGDNILVVPIGLDAMRNLLTFHADEEQRLALVTDDHEVILTLPDVPDAERVAVEQTIHEERLFATRPVAGTDLNVHLALNWSTFWSNTDTVRQAIVLAGAAAFLLAALLVVLIHQGILRPVRRLDKTMHQAMQDHAVRAAERGPTELLSLTRRFNVLLDARDRARERLSAAVADLAKVREEEKRELAIALHDHAIQDLVATRWFLEQSSTEQTDSVDLEKIRDSLDNGIEALRHQTVELMGSSVENADLAAALEGLVTGVSNEHGIVGHVDHNLTDQLPEDVEKLAFRTIREAVRNVIKHSGATDVFITVDHVGDQLDVSVRDNGSGFRDQDVVEQVKEGHVGVISMRESVAAAGGRFSLSSSPGGTVASFTIPISAPGDQHRDQHRQVAGGLSNVSDGLHRDRPAEDSTNDSPRR